MANEQMPNYRLKGFRVWSHRLGINRRHNGYGVAHFRSIAPIAADDTEHLRSNLFCILQCTNQINADILFEVAAADRKDEERIARSKPARY